MAETKLDPAAVEAAAQAWKEYLKARHEDPDGTTGTTIRSRYPDALTAALTAYEGARPYDG